MTVNICRDSKVQQLVVAFGVKTKARGLNKKGPSFIPSMLYVLSAGLEMPPLVPLANMFPRAGYF